MITPQGFEITTIVGTIGIYGSYDVYGFDQYELTMGIRIKDLTGKLPTRDDADYCLSAIADPDLTLDQQNTIIINYMKKYPDVS